MENHLFRKIGKKLLETNPRTKAEMDAFKRKISKEHKIPYPGNRELFSALRTLPKSQFPQRPEFWENLLRLKPVRSLSGIVNVSVLAKPYPCPGNCLYCPNEPGFPKSYISGAPAADRAKTLGFNPYKQVKGRLEMLAGQNHPVGKIELRVIGGTWSAYARKYRESFIARCFEACNNFDKKISAQKTYPLLTAEQKKNESARCRIVGISVETRPDHIGRKEIISLRKLGITRVELGIQSIYDGVLKKTGAGIKQTR